MAEELAGKGFEFPCSYPLKVVGKNTNEFYSVVSALIERHLPSENKVTYSSRKSSGDKYLAITATFTMESREQLEAIYSELKGNDLVLTTL
jgi:uncharacterized protein